MPLIGMQIGAGLSGPGSYLLSAKTSFGKDATKPFLLPVAQELRVW
jgi:hypothetical protein